MNFGIENEYKEFKESLAQLDKAIKSLTAMVNKNGRGTVYFGVNDNGDVVGLKLGKKYLDEIRDKISNFVQPQLLYKAEEKYDNSLLYIELTAEGNDIPYSFDGRYYIRNIRSDELMDNNMIRHAMSSSIADILKASESELQDLKLESGEEVYTRVANLVEKWGEDLRGEYGYSSIAAVVGATYPEQLKSIRETAPHTYFLIPGYGAQGGKAEDIALGFDKEGLGGIVNASRSLMCAYKSDKWKEQFDEKDYAKATRAEAIRMRDEITSAL